MHDLEDLSVSRGCGPADIQTVQLWWSTFRVTTTATTSVDSVSEISQDHEFSQHR